MNYYVRYCTTNAAHLCESHTSLGEALEAACWLWIDHKVVQRIERNFEVALSEDQVKQMVQEELPGESAN